MCLHALKFFASSSSFAISPATYTYFTRILQTHGIKLLVHPRFYSIESVSPLHSTTAVRSFGTKNLAQRTANRTLLNSAES